VRDGSSSILRTIGKSRQEEDDEVGSDEEEEESDGEESSEEDSEELQHTKTVKAKGSAKKPKRKRNTTFNKAGALLGDFKVEFKDEQCTEPLVFMEGRGIRCRSCNIEVSHRDMHKLKRHCKSQRHLKSVVRRGSEAIMREKVRVESFVSLLSLLSLLSLSSLLSSPFSYSSHSIYSRSLFTPSLPLPLSFTFLRC
jgi:hypothetical protein